MVGDLFDNPWTILIVAIVILVLFGSKKVPHAVRSLGQPMRIFRREAEGLREDEPQSGGSGTPGVSRDEPNPP
jgi:sec-independent protein translocase protein TatA